MTYQRASLACVVVAVSLMVISVWLGRQLEALAEGGGEGGGEAGGRGGRGGGSRRGGGARGRGARRLRRGAGGAVVGVLNVDRLDRIPQRVVRASDQEAEEDHGHDHHAGHPRQLRPGGSDDLAQLHPDTPKVSGQASRAASSAPTRREPGPGRRSGHVLYRPPTLDPGLAGRVRPEMAGAARFELATLGFGDRCSTN